MIKDIQQLQAQFMDACGQLRLNFPVATKADAHSIEDEIGLWVNLVNEEFAELMEACYLSKQEDFDEVLSNICSEAVDLVYVTMGLMNALGLPFMKMFEAVHEANMAKCVDGKVIKNAAGKVLKPEGWRKADTLGIIKAARRGA